MTAFRIRLLKVLDATLGAILCRLARHLRRFRSAASHPAMPSDPKTILVIRPGGLGDLVLLLPMLHRLKTLYPLARIDLVCEKRNQTVLPLSGLAIHPLVYDTLPLSFLRKLWRTPYDLAIDSEQFHHFSALFTALSGAPIRIGFNINPLRNPLYTHGVHYETNGYEGKQFMRLLQPIDPAPPPGIPAGILRDALPSTSVSTDKSSAPFALVHPGATSRYKQWMPTRFVELAVRMADELDIDIAILTDAHPKRAAADVLKAVVQKQHPRIRVVQPQTLDKTAALIRCSRILVGSDSGLIHLATALGTPTVTLFGPSDPAKWSLPSPHHPTVRHPLPCAPCALFGYHTPCRTIACMKAIAVVDVLAAIQSLLATKM